jgi:hypothetical protein
MISQNKIKGTYMAGIYFNYDDLYSLIKHEIALHDRFDNEFGDAFSIIFFKAKDSDSNSIATIFQRMLRQTDAIFHRDSNYFILLSKTDYNGGYAVLQGIHEFFGREEMRECIVTFSDDGASALELVTKLKQSIKKWYDLDVDVV